MGKQKPVKGCSHYVQIYTYPCMCVVVKLIESSDVVHTTHSVNGMTVVHDNVEMHMKCGR